MVNVLTPEELLKLIRSEGRAVVGVDLAESPYCAIISCIFWDRDSTDLEATLNRKGYLLNRSQMRTYSLPL